MVKACNIFHKKLVVINIGLKTFAEDMKKQGVETLHVDWQPPAGGDEEILRLLDELDEES